MVIFSFHTDDRMSSSWLEIVKNPDKSLSSWQKLTNGIQSVADFWCFHSELFFRFSFGNCRATSMVFMYWEYVWFIKKKQNQVFKSRNWQISPKNTKKCHGIWGQNVIWTKWNAYLDHNAVVAPSKVWLIFDAPTVNHFWEMVYGNICSLSLKIHFQIKELQNISKKYQEALKLMRPKNIQKVMII